ncbi:helix-turn-helix domain-containing protein [Yoonia sediminilitoris]|uniref:AraC family transcriptional regulator n=1 Tax=Yoonia sediminilitoris TaxID=1286148 RepID=A0A2T6KS17_9RHOB|nr:AraC family transcriptional regulator [Yoonia sediminilitoris]PUB19354.1 AraC family transcriptional regulator [Yoonia sediminilitoris]RCW99522.1 AraC family transcriptional regulator [Yoonia sediminilitoris]
MSMIRPTPTTTLALRSLSFAPPAMRWRTEAMRSHDTGRLIHVTKGQGRITVAGLTGGYGPNNLIYIPPHTMYGMEVGPTVFAQIMTLPADTENWPATSFHLRLLDVAIQKELQGLVEAIERELQPTGNVRAALCHLGLLNVFVERQLAKAGMSSSDARRQTAAARLVARYTEMIARGFRTDTSVADYAAALNVTPTHLTRCCKHTCDRSALGLLNDRIYYEACTLLRETDTAVQDIAKSLCFQSAAYFTRSFQSRAGLTPSEFRKKLAHVTLS